MRVRRPLGSSRPTRPVGQGPVTSGVTTSPRTRSAAGSASDHPFAARNLRAHWHQSRVGKAASASNSAYSTTGNGPRAPATHVPRASLRALSPMGASAVPRAAPPGGPLGPRPASTARRRERGGGVAREDALGASGGLRAAAARYVKGVAVPPGTVRDTEAARRRTYQRRSSSAPHTTNGKGATKSSSSAESEAVPSSA